MPAADPSQPSPQPQQAIAAESQQAAAPEPLVRSGLRRFLAIDRWDVLAVVLIVVLSLGLRLVSPLYAGTTPDGKAVSGGLGYPWNGNEAQPATSGDLHCGSHDASGLPVESNGKVIINDPKGKKPEDIYTVVCGYVFDEIYFPTDALKDLHQPSIDYFDPEPPLTKLLMTPSIAVLGFNTWGWRITCALFGSLLAGVMYLIAKRLRRDRFFAVAAAIFVSLDGLVFVESRIGVIDIIAIFWAAFTYYAFLLHWQARSRTQWKGTLYFLAAVVGLGFSAKLTELAPLAIIAGFIALRFLQPRLTKLVKRLPRFADLETGPEGRLWRQAAGWYAPVHYVVAVVIVVAVFGVSFSRYITVDHPGVVQYDGCTLPGGPSDSAGPDPNMKPPQISKGVGSFLTQAFHDIYKVNTSALSYHSMECRSHPYQSRWDTWPYDFRPVLMYSGSVNVPGDAVAESSIIANYGNPAVWWMGIPALLFCGWQLTRGRLWWRIGLPAIGAAGLIIMVLSFNFNIMYWNSAVATTSKSIPVFAHGKLVIDTANHKPSKPDSVYSSAADFKKAVGRDPSPSDEIPPVHGGLIFDAGFGLVILFCAGVIFSAIVSRRFVPGFILVGYFASWLMWAPGNEQRILFFYHALGMLLFTALALAYAATALRTVRIGKFSLAPAAYALVATVIVAFVFFYPVWTGSPLPQVDAGMRTWYDTQ